MVKYGIDVLMGDSKYDSILKGKRIGLITNPTGIDSNFRPTVELLNERYDVQALFAPEHGIRGNIGAGVFVENTTDIVTGIPVYSLYSKGSKHLSKEMLSKVDIMVYDIQDVGSRYYTYIYTMLYSMESCAENGIPFVVLDRPNPLGGECIEGNVVKKDYMSFVGGYPLCMRYGLTIGEFATMANKSLSNSAEITVIPCEGWKRSMLWPDTKLTWIMPSPGLPCFESALLYSGTCLFEGTNLSEGRGTALPFEIIGAPYIDDPQSLAAQMNAKKLPGVHFRPVYFTPSTSKHSGIMCGGVQIHIMNIREIRPVRVAISLMYEIQERWGEHFDWCTPLPPATRPHIDLLGGDGQLVARTPLNELIKTYKQDEEAFAADKQAYHLYE